MLIAALSLAACGCVLSALLQCYQKERVRRLAARPEVEMKVVAEKSWVGWTAPATPPPDLAYVFSRGMLFDDGGFRPAVNASGAVLRP